MSLTLQLPSLSVSFSFQHSVCICWSDRTAITGLIIDSFNTVLFSALKQTHGAPVVGDSEWVTVAF